MAKKTKSNPTLEDLFTDPEQLKRMNAHLYSRKPLLEPGGPFAEMLRTGIHAARPNLRHLAWKFFANSN